MRVRDASGKALAALLGVHERDPGRRGAPACPPGSGDSGDPLQSGCQWLHREGAGEPRSGEREVQAPGGRGAVVPRAKGGVGRVPAGVGSDRDQPAEPAGTVDHPGQCAASGGGGISGGSAVREKVLFIRKQADDLRGDAALRGRGILLHGQ